MGTPMRRGSSAVIAAGGRRAMDDRVVITVAPAVELPIIHDSDRYELVREIRSGSFGIARLMLDRRSRELVAVKYIERGGKIDDNVLKEIINHRSLRHPNIISFREVILTPTHLAIVMEYASGGELFKRIRNAGCFSEVEARRCFQQLVSGVCYCHGMHICHRDLKLENVLLDGSSAPRLKICDFAYSKSPVQSQPKSAIGSPAYIAPEVLLLKHYDGKIADVWSCGVALYVMLVGSYPFEDPKEPKNIRKAIELILGAEYSIPGHIDVSPECRELLAMIFVADPSLRTTMPEVCEHEWFLKDLPADLMEQAFAFAVECSKPFGQTLQGKDEIVQIVTEAGIPPAAVGDRGDCYCRMACDSIGFYDVDYESDQEVSDSDLDNGSLGERVFAM